MINRFKKKLHANFHFLKTQSKIVYIMHKLAFFLYPQE